MTLTNPQQIRVDAFNSHVRHLAQQEASKILPYVDKDSPQAETNAWDFLGIGESGTKSRNTASAGNETGRQWSRRQAVAVPYIDHELVESQDPTMMMTDPNSKLIRSMGYAAGRAYDDIILSAAVGNANVITRSSGAPTTTATALDSGSKIGNGTAAISFDLIAQVVKKFGTFEIDPTVFKIAVIAPHQVYELLNLTEQVSADYVNRKAVQTLNASGVVENWMGFHWIMNTRTPIQTNDMRTCVFMTIDAMGFHQPQELTTYFQRDPSRQYAWRPQCEFTAGAVRLEDKQIVALKVAETGTVA